MRLKTINDAHERDLAINPFISRAIGLIFKLIYLATDTVTSAGRITRSAI
jgi:hypothetical protein